MVVGNVQTASVDSTIRRAQDAIAAVGGQILPGGICGAGSGFVSPEPPYSNAALLYGGSGGLVDTTPAAYSAASTLDGLSLLGSLPQVPWGVLTHLATLRTPISRTATAVRWGWREAMPMR